MLWKAQDVPCRKTLNSPEELPELHTSLSEFVDIRQTCGVYVDKTGLSTLTAPLVTDRSPKSLFADAPYHLLTRPRRFGKTLLISTLEAWFQGRPRGGAGEPWTPPRGSQQRSPRWRPQDLFQHLAIRQWREPKLFRPVIRLDMSAVQGDSVAELQQSLRYLLAETLTTWHQRGLDVPYAEQAQNNEIRLPTDTDPSDCLYRLIRYLHQVSKVRPVVLVDEYDAPPHPNAGDDRSQRLIPCGT